MPFFAHVNFAGKPYHRLAFPALAFLFGSYLDKLETERMVMFRDKSALYGRELAEGEKPSWP